jgi:hypothetical protein
LFFNTPFDDLRQELGDEAVVNYGDELFGGGEVQVEVHPVVLLAQSSFDVQQVGADLETKFYLFFGLFVSVFDFWDFYILAPHQTLWAPSIFMHSTSQDTPECRSH